MEPGLVVAYLVGGMANVIAIGVMVWGFRKITRSEPATDNHTGGTK